MSQGHNWCIEFGKNDYWCDYASSQSVGVNCDRLKLAFQIQVLVLTMLLLSNQAEAIYILLLSNKWLDREVKQYDEGVPQSIC